MTRSWLSHPVSHSLLRPLRQREILTSPPEARHLLAEHRLGGRGLHHAGGDLWHDALHVPHELRTARSGRCLYSSIRPLPLLSPLRSTSSTAQAKDAVPIPRTEDYFLPGSCLSVSCGASWSSSLLYFFTTATFSLNCNGAAFFNASCISASA